MIYKSDGTEKGVGGGAVALARQEFWKSISIDLPMLNDSITVGFSPAAFTISSMRAVVRGGTPSVTWSLHYGTDRSAAGTEVVVGGTVTSSETSGSDVTAFDNAQVAADAFYWVEVTAVSDCLEFHLSIFAEED